MELKHRDARHLQTKRISSFTQAKKRSGFLGTRPTADNFRTWQRSTMWLLSQEVLNDWRIDEPKPWIVHIPAPKFLFAGLVPGLTFPYQIPNEITQSHSEPIQFNKQSRGISGSFLTKIHEVTSRLSGAPLLITLPWASTFQFHFHRRDEPDDDDAILFTFAARNTSEHIRIVLHQRGMILCKPTN